MSEQSSPAYLLCEDLVIVDNYFCLCKEGGSLGILRLSSWGIALVDTPGIPLRSAIFARGVTRYRSYVALYPGFCCQGLGNEVDL